MNCPKCRYVMSDLDMECPRCAKLAVSASQLPTDAAMWVTPTVPVAKPNAPAAPSPPWVNRVLTIGFSTLGVAYVGACLYALVFPAPKKVTPTVISVPAYFGLDIDQVKARLGKPIDGSEVIMPNGDDSEDYEWYFPGVEVDVGFHIRTRQVIDFYVATRSPDGYTTDLAALEQAAGVDPNSGAYRVVPQHWHKNSDQYCGIEIVPPGSLGDPTMDRN